jgi:hypothetical protein
MTEAEEFHRWRWPQGTLSNVIDAVPALIRKAAMEAIYSPPRPSQTGQIISVPRRVA